MGNNIEGAHEGKGNVPSVVAVGVGILSAAVLAYCGYKLIDNKLNKTEYEPDPNKETGRHVQE